MLYDNTLKVLHRSSGILPGNRPSFPKLGYLHRAAQAFSYHQLDCRFADASLSLQNWCIAWKTVVKSPPLDLRTIKPLFKFRNMRKYAGSLRLSLEMVGNPFLKRLTGVM